MTSVLIAVLLLGPVGATGQGPRDLDLPGEIQPFLVVPEGTVIPIVLTSEISTRNAKEGDGVYGRTVFPITVDNQIVIPVNSYVRGRIVGSERAGRISGKAELTINFQTIVLPSGLTLSIFGSLGGIGGTTGERRGEATVEADSGTGADAATIGTNAGIGAGVGAIGGGARGIGIGAGVGAAAGVAQVLLGRGEDVVLRPGTMIEIVLDVPLEP